MNINKNTYQELVKYYDNTLNIDKSTFKTSNDEPTPIICIEEMINKLPSDIWKKNDLKILDPCCGNGNFFIPINKELLNNYSQKYILENILHFNDINEDRINNVKKIFCEDEYKLNITKEDFLEKIYDNKFDLIVANPPYALINNDGKRTSKNHNLIKDFLDKSLKILRPNGYILYITPDNWMSYADRNILIKEITKLQIIYLNIHTAKKYFKKIGSSFTWYIIQNCKYYKDIEIEGIWKKQLYSSFVKSQERKYIPLYYNKIIQSILSKTIDNDNLVKFKVENSSYLHKYTKKNNIKDNMTEDFKYKLIHTPSQTVWSNIPHKYQDNYKVFISTTDKYITFIDNCGMTQSIAFIKCESEEQAKIYKIILDHPLYQFINNICRWGNFNCNRILQQFPIPNINEIDNIYNYFNITKDEIDLIEKDINNINYTITKDEIDEIELIEKDEIELIKKDEIELIENNTIIK